MQAKLIAPVALTFPTVQKPDGSTMTLEPGEVGEFPDGFESPFLEVIGTQSPEVVPEAVASHGPEATQVSQSAEQE